MLIVDERAEHIVRIIDISLSGAAFSSDLDLPMGTPVRVGSTPGKIVRRFDGGYAIEFRFPLSADILDEIRKTYVGIKSVNQASITQLEQTESHLQVSLQKVVMDRDHSFVIRVLAKQYVHTAEGLKAGLRLSKRTMS